LVEKERERIEELIVPFVLEQRLLFGDKKYLQDVFFLLPTLLPGLSPLALSLFPDLIAAVQIENQALNLAKQLLRKLL
jgi:hypothetical protein